MYGVWYSFRGQPIQLYGSPSQIQDEFEASSVNREYNLEVIMQIKLLLLTPLSMQNKATSKSMIKETLKASLCIHIVIAR